MLACDQGCIPDTALQVGAQGINRALLHAANVLLPERA
jgi:hypothetical protein